LFVLLLAVALPVTTAAQELRPMTTDDGLDMVRVGNPLMSPDGEWVFFSKSVLQWKENKRKTTYHMVPAGGGDSFQFVGEAGGSSFQFSPQGTYLSFTRAVKDTAQLFLMRTDGGEGVQLTKHATPVGSYRWSSDESKIFFVSVEPRSKEEATARKRGDDAIFVDEGPNGQREGRWNNLWVFDVAEKEEARLTEEEFRIGSFDVSPDGSQIVFTARWENRRNQQNLSEIYLLDVESKERTRITENQAPESGLKWAPDGTRFAYTANDYEDWELRNSKIWIMDPVSREARMVSGDFEGRIRGFEWTPDSEAILFTGLQKTNTNLYGLTVPTGTVSQLTRVEGNLSVSSFSKDRTRFVYTYSDFDTPADLWTARVGDRITADAPSGGTRLTQANPTIESEIALAKGEVVRWRSRDGTEIEGILYLPHGHDRAGRLPLLLHIHGGPAGVFTNSFSTRAHVWAGLGYAQLQPNVRGSSGYSDELLRGNMNDIGGGDYEDLMTGVDYLIDQGIADPEHLALRGWSYGGILGGWTITQTDRFKAASVGAMVSDWTSEYGPGFNHDVRLWYIGGTPWENPEDYRYRSALTHVANVTTPTIILHGMRDITDTEPQSMMFFQALKDQGKTARYIRFPREPHGFREPHHQRIRDIEEIRWIQKYARGIEWTPWERPADEDEDEEKEEKREEKGG
jgi:dipeptidyl aminopeptidase/acylaminoacyl peptidase